MLEDGGQPWIRTYRESWPILEKGPWVLLLMYTNVSPRAAIAERARDAGTSWNTKPVSIDLARMLPYWCIRLAPTKLILRYRLANRHTHVSLRVRALYVLNATRIIGSPFVSNLDIKSALRFPGVRFHVSLRGMLDKSFVMFVINLRCDTCFSGSYLGNWYWEKKARGTGREVN